VPLLSRFRLKRQPFLQPSQRRFLPNAAWLFAEGSVVPLLAKAVNFAVVCASPLTAVPTESRAGGEGRKIVEAGKTVPSHFETEPELYIRMIGMRDCSAQCDGRDFGTISKMSGASAKQTGCKG